VRSLAQAPEGRQVARENDIQKTGGIDPADLAPLRRGKFLGRWCRELPAARIELK
jgi:hypothetical protein